MKVLVLGGCGFIGSHIVDALLLAGHQVRVLDRSPEKFRMPLHAVDYMMGSLASKALLHRALQGVNAVVHSVSTTTPATSNQNPQADVQENLIATLGLLDVMLECDVKKIVFLSSGGTVYGTPKSLPISEKHELNPLCSYGVVKIAIEKYLLLYQQLYGLETTIIRPANPYGERQYSHGNQGVIAAFSEAALAGKSIHVWGDGSIIRDYFHVTDLARLCCLAIERNTTGVFNAGSGCGHSINEIVQIMSQSFENPINTIYSEARDCDVNKVVLDIGKVNKFFDWTPNICLEDGVSNYIDWLRTLKS